MIACLLGVCFIAAVGLTVAAVSGKTGGTRKSNAVWVIKEATTSYYTGTSKYRYTYDDNGREILRVIETTRDGEEPVTNTVETCVVTEPPFSSLCTPSKLDIGSIILPISKM